WAPPGSRLLRLRRAIGTVDAFGIFPVDPPAVITAAQDPAPHQAACDRSPWNEHRPQMPDLVIGRPLLGGSRPKNVERACDHTRHCGSTVSGRILAATHRRSIGCRVYREK